MHYLTAIIIFAFSHWGLSGCQGASSTAAANEADSPALVTSLNPAQLQEIKTAISQVYPDRSINLLPDVFSTSHILVLTNNPSGGANAKLAGGRITRPQEVFHLVRNSAGCALVHVATQQRFPLSFDCQKQ